MGCCLSVLPASSHPFSYPAKSSPAPGRFPGLARFTSSAMFCIFLNHFCLLGSPRAAARSYVSNLPSRWTLAVPSKPECPCPRTLGLAPPPPQPVASPHSSSPAPRPPWESFGWPTFSSLRMARLSVLRVSRPRRERSFVGGRHTGPTGPFEKRPFREPEEGDPAGPRCASRASGYPRGEASFRPGAREPVPTPTAPPAGPRPGAPPDRRASRPPPRRPPRREPGRRAAASQWPGTASPRARIPATRAPRPHRPPARAPAFAHPPRSPRGAPETKEKEARLAALVTAP